MKFILFRIFKPIARKDIERLLNIYQTSTNHEVRVRCHIILLFSSKFSLTEIQKILYISENYRYSFKVIRYWFYNKFNVLSASNLDEFKPRVEFKPEPKKIVQKHPRSNIELRKIFSNAYKYIILKLLFVFDLLKKGYNYLADKIYIAFNYVIKSFGRLISWFSGIDFKKHYRKYFDNSKQIAKIYVKKGAKVKNIVQINIDKSGMKNSIQDIYAETLSSLRKEILDMLNKVDSKRISSNDAILSLALMVNDKIQNVKKSERKKKYLAALATFIAMYIWYHTAIKAGVLLFTIFGATYSVINFNTWLTPTSYESENDIVQEIPRDSSDIDDPVIVDSDSIVPQSYGDTLTDDIPRKIPLTFSPKDDCYYLSEIGMVQLEYIENNKVNILEEDYYVDVLDDRYYIHVAAYRNLEYARFQRLYLISRGYNNAKIIKHQGKYYLSLFDYNLAGLWLSCDAKDDWNQLCDIEKSKARIIYNG